MANKTPNPEQAARNKAFKKEVQNLIITSPYIENLPLRKFLDDVLPPVSKNHFVFVSNGSECTNLPYTRNQVIDVLCILAEQRNWTVYYHPAVFTEWINLKFTVGTAAIVIDIDHIDFGSFTLETATKYDIVRWLMLNYYLLPEQLPNYVTLSGNHGMHLTYLIDYLTDRDVFNSYIKRGICFFNSDKKCRNMNRMFRLPTSYNVKQKDNPVRSKLFVLNESPSRDIHRLDDIFPTDSEITEYFKTKAQKKQEEKSYDRKKKAPPSTAIKKEAYSNDVYDDFEPIDISHLKPMSYYNGGGAPYNVIADLHNFVIHSGGECLRNNRNNFIHILASYAVLCNWSQKKTIRFCEQYFSKGSSFYNEMLQCINASYSREEPYLYSCITINEILDMGEYADIAHCCFTEERRTQRQKEYNHKQYLKRKAKMHNKPSKPKEREIYVTQNFDKDPKVLASDLNVSLSTIYRIKERILKNNSTTNICSI